MATEERDVTTMATAEDLEGALLVMVVSAENRAQVWVNDAIPREHHALWLRMMADQLDPPETSRDRADGD